MSHNNSNKNKTASILRWVTIGISVVLLIVLIWMLLGGMGGGPKLKAYDGPDSILSMLEKDEVGGIYVSGNYTVYVWKKNSEIKQADFEKNPTKYSDYYAVAPVRYGEGSFAQAYDRITTELAASNPDYVKPAIRYDDPSEGSAWTSMLFPILSFIIMAVVIFFIFRQSAGANRQAMDFGKNRARLNANVNVKFTDVAGAEEEKEELKEIVDFLKNPQKFTHLGARIPKGVLLIGPPGTGKTLFAKAVAGESNVPFFSISGSDFVEMFVGTGAARVRDLFDQAKRNMPCIIFIDEIDAVGRHRGAGLGGGHDEREQTLNQLLVQMDGFEKNEGIIIMAATNRADILDPALLRPGRFDRQIYVNTPDVRGREAIFKVHARNKPLADDISFKVLARMTSGFSGADIENLLNEAAILAAREDRKVIVMEDILEAINKVIAGPQKKSRVITQSDKRITAYHESGHAIIAKVLEHCDEVQEVSIIPRGMAAGYTLTRPDSDDAHVSRNKLLDMITMMLGGRAAEEIVIHDISTGASNDIQRASQIAKSMVTEWGMSDKVGTFFLGGEKEVFLGKDYGAQHSYSEELGGVIDSEIKAILDQCHARALELLRQYRSVMDNMVRVLFEKETIYTNEVEMLFEGKSAQEVIEAIEARGERKNAYRMRADEKAEPAQDKQADKAVTDASASAADAPKTDAADASTPKADETTPKQDEESKSDDAPKAD